MNNENNNSQGTFKMSDNWDTQSKALKVKFSELTDEDLNYEPGHEEALLKRVGTRLNKQREEVIGLIREDQTAPEKN